MSTVELTSPAVPQTRAMPTRRAVVGWVLYDLANTIFSMTIISLYFSLWVRDQVGADRADTVYGITAAISYAIIFILSPLLGAWTDQAPKRMPFLVASTLLCVAFTALLGQGGFYISLGLFILANIAYQAGIQFYDALLPEVSTEENRGTIGGYGVGIGYLGSYIGVGVGLLLFNKIGYTGVFQIAAALFLLFALPCFFFVRERINPRARRFSLDSIPQAFQQVKNTLLHVQRYPGVARFLIGRIFYTDPINTVITIMGLYVTNLAVSRGLSSEDGQVRAQYILLGAITFAVLGGLLWGRVVDRIGPKRALDIILITWIVVFILISLMGFLGLPLVAFYFISAIAGFALGGTWASDRPYMQRISPPAKLGEFYGLYGMVGRFSAITGPLIWAVSLFVSGRIGLAPEVGQAVAVLLLMLLIVVSYFILRPVSDAHRVWTGDDALER